MLKSQRRKTARNDDRPTSSKAICCVHSLSFCYVAVRYPGSPCSKALLYFFYPSFCVALNTRKLTDLLLMATPPRTAASTHEALIAVN